MNELRLRPAETAYWHVDGNREVRRVVPFLDYVVDGTSLRELWREAGQEGGDLVTGLCRAWPASVAPTVQALLGSDAERSARVELLVCSVCGDADCGALLASVTVDDDRVTWDDWGFTAAGGTHAVRGLPRYTFDRRTYDAEVGAAAAAVAGLPYDRELVRARRFLWPWQWGWRLPPIR